MAKIAQVEADHFRIPLDVPLSDSTHGTMEAFELVTARVRDADGAEGVGYTYTTGHNGRAVRATLDEIAAALVGSDADLIEASWTKVWWLLHYGGRGGAAVLAQSAFDMALWDLKAKRAKLPKPNPEAGELHFTYPMLRCAARWAAMLYRRGAALGQYQSPSALGSHHWVLSSAAKAMQL